jgi:putative cardiolipin synthase
MISERLPYGITLLVLLAVLSGCAGVPFDTPKTASHAFEDTTDTYLGQLLQPLAAAHPGESGFYLLRDGIDALAARLLLSEKAERSIDAQYYLLLDDIAGRLFVTTLLKAADRGVRIRVLLDDITTPGYDAGMAAFDAHPNIEIRVFNPFSRGAGRLIGGAAEFRRVTRRMHNKSMTFDNQATIVGGRNIGAEYFSADEEGNFSDLDVLGFGPVAQKVSSAFDLYWNDPVAVPVNLLVDPSEAAAGLIERRERIPEIIEQARQSPYGAALESAVVEAIMRDETSLTWSTASVVADPPQKADQDYSGGHPQQLSSVMGPAVRAAQQELVIVSAYFVPGEGGIALFRELTRRGVRVLIVTNSLATNDVVAVHAGYAPYRKALLEAGVELWEMRPDAGQRDQRRGRLGYSLSGLHTKAFAVDRRYLFIGSFNWDPRSVNINTEMGIYLDAPALTVPTLERMERILPDNAYRLRLNEAEEIEWLSQENGGEVVYHTDPKASFWRRLSSGFLGLLPIEEQL